MGRSNRKQRRRTEETVNQEKCDEAKEEISIDVVDICGPCFVAKNSRPVAGWCETCDELLCADCFQSHCRLKLTRNHQLQSLENMGIIKRFRQVDTTCKIHEGKPLEYFCEDHSKLGCSHCFVTEHRPCSKVVCIAEVNMTESKDFQQIEKQYNKLENRLKADVEKIETGTEMTLQRHDKVTNRIREYGDGLKAEIDKHIEKYLKEAVERKENDLKIMSCAKNRLQEAADKITAVKQLFKLEGYNPRYMYIALKTLQNDSGFLASTLQDVEDNIKSCSQYDFIINEPMADIINRIKSFGTFEEDPEILRMETATDEVVDMFEVCRFLEIGADGLKWSNLGVVPNAFEVRTNKDITLRYISLYRCQDEVMQVVLKILQNEIELVSCKSKHSGSGSEMVDVKVVQEDQKEGLTLRSGCIYCVSVLITGGCSKYGAAGVKSATVEGVKFNYSPCRHVLSTTDEMCGQIPSLKFTVP